MTVSQTATQSKPTYATGTPVWVDLGTPDLPASVRFYSELFGWQGEDMGEQMGHYTMMSQDGKPVAAIAPLMSRSVPLRVFAAAIRSTDSPAWRAWTSVIFSRKADCRSKALSISPGVETWTNIGRP